MLLVGDAPGDMARAVVSREVIRVEPSEVRVRDWTRIEIRALRWARRMSVREFAAHLGVSERIVPRWEHATTPTHPLPVNQAALDTSLRQADADTRRRFAELVAEHRGRSAAEGGAAE